MKVKIFFVCGFVMLSLFSNSQNSSQTLKIRGFTFGVGATTVFGDDIDALNTIVKKVKYIDTISNVFADINIGYFSEDKNKGIGYYFLFHSIHSQNFNSSSSNPFSLSVDGYSIKNIITLNLIKKESFQLKLLLGNSFNKFNLKIVDKTINNFPLDSLFTNSAFPPSLNLTTKGTLYNVDLGIEALYNIKFLNKYFDAYDIGFRTVYSQNVFNSKQLVFDISRLPVNFDHKFSFNHLNIEFFFRAAPRGF